MKKVLKKILYSLFAFILVLSGCNKSSETPAEVSLTLAAIARSN